MSAARELDELFPVVYEELRRVAHRHMRGELTGHTLSTTALVHEAYLEMAKLRHVNWPGREYVLAAASQAMRRVLVDYAVARKAGKRGGGAIAEPIDDAVMMAADPSLIFNSDDSASMSSMVMSLRAMRMVPSAPPPRLLASSSIV